MDAPLFGVSAFLIALAMATYLACAPRPPRQEPFHMARRARVVLFAAAFTSTFLLIPPAAAALDRLIGRDGMGTLFSSLTSGLTLLCLQIVTVNWTHPTARVRRAVAGRICFVGTVMAVLVWEFHYTHASSAELASVSPGSGEAAAYVLTHLLFLDVMAIAVCLQNAVLARAAWPHHRVAATGLAITALGNLCGVTYAAVRTGAAIAYLAGSAWPSAVETRVVPVTGALAAFFVTLGLTLPTIAHRIVLPLHQSVKGRTVSDIAVRRIALP